MTYFRSISFRVTFWVSVVVVVIVSIHIYLMRPERRFFELKMQESERVADIIETHLLAEMLAGEPDNIQGHLELLPEQAGIRRVEIVDENLVVHFSTDRKRLGVKVNREQERPCLDCHGQEVKPQHIVYRTDGGGPLFAVDHVLYNEPRCRTCHENRGPILGNILVELSLTEAETAALIARKRLVLAAGILVVVMLLGMGTIIHFLVGRPVTQLLSRMKRIEAGDFDMGPPAAGSNEFRTLEDGFQRMVEKLRDLYNRMESIIDERTNKLYETQAQVMHQEKLAGIGQLAAGVAHEIGNPLTAIDSMVQLLAADNNDAEFRKTIDTIQRQVDRISTIVHNMADLSRPLSMDTDYVNINNVIHAVLGLVRYDGRFRNIETVTELDETTPCVRAVEDRIFGVFLNLVLNAADAMPEGGTLHISSLAKGDRLVVVFRDTGHGIAKENLEKVFDPYFTTKARGSGTGLGLSVCRTFLRGLGGDIEVESEVGKGSVFRVLVPLVTPAEVEEPL